MRITHLLIALILSTGLAVALLGSDRGAAPPPARAAAHAAPAADSTPGVADITAFGAVPDARYEDLSTGRYYADSGHTRPATDNTAAIQAAINSLLTSDPGTSGGIVFVPKGQYMTRPLYVPYPGRIHLRGTGLTSALVLAPNADGYLLTLDSGYSTLTDVMFDCNRGAQSQGGCLRLTNHAHYVRVENVRLVRAHDWALYTTGGGQQTFDNVQFLESGGGVLTRFNTPINFVNGTNFEDNDSVGLRIEGGVFNSIVNVQGAYFENNGRASHGLAHQIHATGIENHELGQKGTQILNVHGSYFNGNKSADHLVGIAIDGKGVSGFDITGNEFRDLTPGPFEISSHAADAVGTNRLTGNTYVGTTPRPEKAGVPTDFFGYVTDGSVHSERVVPLQMGTSGGRPADLLPGGSGYGVRVEKLTLSCDGAGLQSARQATVAVGTATSPDGLYHGAVVVGPGTSPIDLASRLSRADLPGPSVSELQVRVLQPLGVSATCYVDLAYLRF